MSNSYDNTDPLDPPAQGAANIDSIQFASPKRKNTAKRKTQSAWTAFVLWLRTKLLRMGKTANS
jgi:hypothetical protein